ncbi:hypothetical protein [Bradyrhizobium roseum]|uniref:hypothetical protein n=1 Tax=Bradyrhizobium roseum TaxID=3056648 RepID=UPI002628FE2C|nr:hypothetical protein [Bradyrhizobium roseus]WKA26408.1 hypothetical protein QUH67_22745 [Bradyrhizobium roseus]
MSAMDRIEVGIWTRLSTSSFVSSYRAIFSIHEIDSDITLKWLSGTILLGFHLTFFDWIYSYSTTVKAVTDGTYVCWPIFQSCGSLIFLSALSEGYSQSTLFMALFGLMVTAVYAIWLQRWEFVHLIILVLFLFKIYFTAISFDYNSNFNFLHSTQCLIYLVCPYKRFFAQLSWLTGSFVATLAKIHPTWLLGQHYSSLKMGIALLPNGSEAILMAFIILMQMAGVWFLMSSNRFRQRLSLSVFTLLYVQYGIQVGYRFPVFELALLLILFGPWFESCSHPPLTRRAIPGWIFIAGLAILQLIPHLAQAGGRLTNEDNIADIFGGPYQFEVNEQCYGEIRLGEQTVRRFEQTDARLRCIPYRFWYRAKISLCSSAPNKYHMTYRRSVNGNPFKEIVNEADLCNLNYRPLGRNGWIKREDEAPWVGLPVQNDIVTRRQRPPT